MDFTAFTSPLLLRGDAHTAYRDPAAYFHAGVFYLYFTLVETEPDGTVYLYLAMTTSTDLIRFTPVRKLSPRDRTLNLSSPGNVIRFGGRFCLCCQSYCRENGEKYGNASGCCAPTTSSTGTRRSCCGSRAMRFPARRWGA